jgi:hypothetical protein
LSARRSIHASAAAIYRPMGVKSISNFNRWSTDTRYGPLLEFDNEGEREREQNKIKKAPTFLLFLSWIIIIRLLDVSC